MASESWSDWFARNFGTEAQREAAKVPDSSSNSDGFFSGLFPGYGKDYKPPSVFDTKSISVPEPNAATLAPYYKEYGTSKAAQSDRMPKYRTGTEMGPYDATRMQAAATSGPAVPTPKPRPAMSTPQTDVFLNNDPNDMRPGSLGEAMKLFPGRPLQQAIYYTDPRSGSMQRLGVGADISKLNPDYVARIWEPSNMSGGEKFFRGAFEKQGPNPITYDPTTQSKPASTSGRVKSAPVAPTEPLYKSGNDYDPRLGPDYKMAAPFAGGGHVEAAERHAEHKARPVHAGFINLAVGGRTDHVPMEVAEGSYVIPAQEVGFLGQGNSLAGAKILDKMFPHSGRRDEIHKASGGDIEFPSTNRFGYMQDSYTPPGDLRAGLGAQNLGGLKNMQGLGETGPMGTKIPSARANPRFPELMFKPYTPDVNEMIKKFGAAPREARGGQIHAGNRNSIPIMAAGGEYVISPEDVATYGGGDIDAGHEKLDAFVKYVRAHGLKTVRNLPGPKKN